MWRRAMRRWLMCATVTLAAPQDKLFFEADASPPDKIASRERSFGQDEPQLSELLADPVCKALMARDKVPRETILQLASLVRSNRGENS